MAELTPAQRAAAIKRRKEIWEVLHPEKVVDVTVKAKPSSGTTCPTTPKISARGRVGEGRPEAFAADTSKISGESKQDINRHIARAEALGPAIHEVVGTSLDKGVELDALKSLPVPERKALIDRAKTGETVSARRPVAQVESPVRRPSRLRPGAPPKADSSDTFTSGAIDMEQEAQAPARLCGARSRNGDLCQRAPMPNGRCPLHGGMSTGPRSAEGRARSLRNLKFQKVKFQAPG